MSADEKAGERLLTDFAAWAAALDQGEAFAAMKALAKLNVHVLMLACILVDRLKETGLTAVPAHDTDEMPHSIRTLIQLTAASG